MVRPLFDAPLLLRTAVLLNSGCDEKYRGKKTSFCASSIYMTSGQSYISLEITGEWTVKIAED